MEEYYLAVAYVLSGILGLCVGSFLNVVIYRIPCGMSLSSPPSHCPKCNYQLRWYDNIPVLSYLMLGGKCRSCKSHISIRYTVVEILNALLWLLSVHLFWQKSPAVAVIFALTSSIFISVFFIDLENKIIPDRFHIFILALAIVYIFFDKEYTLLSHIVGGVGGFSVFYLTALLFEKIKKTEGLGGGDIKLVGAVGLLLGWERLLLGLLLSSVPAAVILCVITLIRQKRSEADGEECDEDAGQFPFAPFLTAGFTVAMLFGSNILEWYLNLFV